MILTRIKLWLAAAGAFLVALGAAYWRGKSAGADAAERKRLEGYVETRKRMDEMDINNPDAGREFLRDRQSRRDM